MFGAFGDLFIPEGLVLDNPEPINLTVEFDPKTPDRSGPCKLEFPDGTTRFIWADVYLGDPLLGDYCELIDTGRSLGIFRLQLDNQDNEQPKESK